MNPIHWWRKRFYVIHELHHRLDLAQDTINNRNDLIRMQDEEITRLRRAKNEAERQAEYWQNKAANP